MKYSSVKKTYKNNNLTGLYGLIVLFCPEVQGLALWLWHLSQSFCFDLRRIRYIGKDNPYND